MTTKIINANIVKGDGILKNAALLIENGLIRRVGACSDVCADIVYDACGCYVMPGFIDIHSHGGGGYDFMDASADEMRRISDFHLSHGTTTLVATTLTDTWEAIEAALDNFAALGQERGILHGAHLEGPWFSPTQCGAQDTSAMEKPSAKKLLELLEKYPFIERISLAPEVDDDFAVAKAACERGLVVAMGHTDADFDTAIEAAKAGYGLVTHLYSGMRGVVRVNAYRVAGAVEAALYDDGMTVEVIADGKHLPAGLLKLIYKCKGADRICLVTDSTRGSGMADGEEFILGKVNGGTRAIIEDGVAKLPDRTSFAGSVATGDRLLKTFAELTDVSLCDISAMLSGTPARVMGYGDRGSIEEGLRADLVAVDASLNVKAVFLKGEKVK